MSPAIPTFPNFHILLNFSESGKGEREKDTNGWLGCDCQNLSFELFLEAEWVEG